MLRREDGSKLVQLHVVLHLPDEMNRKNEFKLCQEWILQQGGMIGKLTWDSVYTDATGR